MAGLPRIIYLERDFSGKVMQAREHEGTRYFSEEYHFRRIEEAKAETNPVVTNFIEALRELLSTLE